MRRAVPLLLVLLACVPLAAAQTTPGPSEAPAGPIFVVHPGDDVTIYNTTPLIQVGIAPGARPERVTFTLDRNELLPDEFQVNTTAITYQVPAFFALREGRHNVTVTAVVDGEPVVLDWGFHVSLKPPAAPRQGITLQTVVISVAVLVGLAVLAGGVAYAYLRVRKGFTFEKFFARHPLQRNLLVLYIPLGLGLFLGLAGLAFLPDLQASGIAEDVLAKFPALATPSRFINEYVLIAALLVGVGPYAIDVRRQRKRRGDYERAFAQFLFELGDTVRGGLDPVKGVTELARSETGILRPHLRAAHDQIKLGKPFEQIMLNMVRPMGSPLVTRYARLVGEASVTGGEIAAVIHRAAKDMDELVKVEAERSRQMKTPVFTIYIAFAVLLMMIGSMMDFAPELGGIDLGALKGGDLGGGGAGAGAGGGPPPEGGQVAKLSLEKLQIRFFHLLLVNGLGAGLLLGSFTEGQLRFGLLHAMVMLVAAAVAFPFMLPDTAAGAAVQVAASAGP